MWEELKLEGKNEKCHINAKATENFSALDILMTKLIYWDTSVLKIHLH